MNQLKLRADDFEVLNTASNDKRFRRGRINFVLKTDPIEDHLDCTYDVRVAVGAS
jgi:hypothetical protein